MRNPRLLLCLGLAVAIAGVVLLVWSTAISNPWRPSWEPMPPLAAGMNVAGVFLAVAGLGLAVWGGLRFHARAKLLSGRDKLASWRVGPADLAAFLRNDAARGALLPTLRNSLRFPARAPATGLPIVIGTGAILVGDDLHGTGGRGMVPTAGMLCDVSIIDGVPAMLELTQGVTALDDPTEIFSAGRSGGRRLWVMRLPVPASARAAAQAARDRLDGDIWKINRDWARLTYPHHFEAGGRHAAGPAVAQPAAGSAATGTVATPVATQHGEPAPAASPYRKAQQRFFAGVGGLVVLMGAREARHFNLGSDIGLVFGVLWLVFFLAFLALAIHGGYHYLVRPR